MNGCIDRVVEYSLVEETRDFLQENGYSLQSKSYFSAGHNLEPMLENTIYLLKKQLENKELLERDFTERTNIKIVEIKEQEFVQTQIENDNFIDKIWQFIDECYEKEKCPPCL